MAGGEEVRAIHDYDGQCADCAHLTALLDHADRAATTQRAEIVRLQIQCDAMAAQVADLEDTRWRRHAERRLAIMRNLAPWLATATFGHGKERDAALAMFAEVAEYGEKPERVKEWHAAWEQRSKQP